LIRQSHDRWRRVDGLLSAGTSRLLDDGGVELEDADDSRVSYSVSRLDDRAQRRRLHVSVSARFSKASLSLHDRRLEN
jgi:hypothetical protein